MPLLAALINLLFGKLMLLLGLLFAKRVGLVLLGVTAWATIAGALYATLRQVIIPLANNLFQTSYGSIIGLAFPPAAGACMLAIGTIWAACGMYTYQRTAIAKITGV
jgi:hypothetical protein